MTHCWPNEGRLCLRPFRELRLAPVGKRERCTAKVATDHLLRPEGTVGSSKDDGWMLIRGKWERERESLCLPFSTAPHRAVM